MAFAYEGIVGRRVVPPLVLDRKAKIRRLGLPDMVKFVGHPPVKSRVELSEARPTSQLVSWAESFIFAGSSALLLLLANLLPVYWYLSFFALIPFLFRIIKASPKDSLRLGFLFGLSFFTVSFTDSLFISPFASILKLVSGTALFALFGWLVGWARKRLGFYPSIVALLWLGLEIGLMKLGFTSGLLAETQLSQPFLHGLVGLFGFLTVSAIIVLLNSWLVLAIVESLKLNRPRGKTVLEEKRTWNYSFTRYLFAEKVYIVPEGRAPPFLTS